MNATGQAARPASTKVFRTPDGATSSRYSLSRQHAPASEYRVEAVSPAYTSQDCSGCGERIYKTLSVRTHVCTHCGLILDRDENAARNIPWRGQPLRGVPTVVGALNREPVGL